ncbi:glycosyltransferase family 32 protein [Levilactobacillus tongjiangensis]|uniref:Glycosyltransferase family 32 protein n=1 Tax=Levilactobacillus tongjiangensis TaxID=2486023 RepID=A0ABW1SVI8_9LACO|nr:glycosyltransferase [Levilactobacillus tongjiangensis]
MIPKVIHYCWFGGQPLPDSVTRCLASWRRVCPDYQVKRWDESNWDVTQMPYVRQAYAQKKFAFVADVARLDVIARHGGIYLDTDVELLEPLDAFLTYDAFFGMEEPGRVNTGVGFGAISKHAMVEDLLAQYQQRKFMCRNRPDLTTCVTIAAPLFKEWGVQRNQQIQYLQDKRVVILPPTYFCPEDLASGKLRLTAQSVAIHHYAVTWKPATSLTVTRWKIRSRRIIDAVGGEGSYARLKSWYNTVRSKI